MRRIAGLLLTFVLLLSMIPVAAQAAEIDGEDVILNYGTMENEAGMHSVELMASNNEQMFELADIPAGGNYQNMTPSQEIIDVIKDFEGFSSTAYWDKSQWTYGYGTRASGSGATITRAEAEILLRKVLENDYGKAVNNFCKKNGKQPTQQQFDALLDLTYNVGAGWTTGTAVPSVILEPTAALDVVKGFGAWCRSGGGVSYVHANRRIREALIYLYGEYYLAYGNQDCKSGLKVVGNDDLPRFKTVIFKTKSGTLDNDRTDYAGYYPVGEYYGSFIDATRSGYTLVGWQITKRSNDSVSNGDRISIWNKVEENLELTAVWEKGTFTVAPELPPVDVVEPTEPEMEQLPEVEIDMDRLPFDDVPENAWFRDAISYVYRNEFMNGTSSTTFNPNGSMTRGMLVTVLYRIDGSMPVSEQERECFDDIGGAYYTDAVAWAYANNIVNGVSDTKFDPNRIITRQEAVTIFYRYCVGNNLLGAEFGMDLEDFADQANVAGFATDAFTWAVASGLVEGSAQNGGIYLNPTDNLNRAQTAVLLERCVEDVM